MYYHFPRGRGRAGRTSLTGILKWHSGPGFSEFILILKYTFDTVLRMGILVLQRYIGLHNFICLRLCDDTNREKKKMDKKSILGSELLGSDGI